MYKYRVDATSNFNDETYAEKTVVSHISESQAERITEILNENCGDHSRTYYSVRGANDRLWRGMEELI